MARSRQFLRVYLDTSVGGGCFDVEYAKWSNALVRDFRRGHLVPVLSDHLASELVDAPPPVRGLHAELVAMTDEILLTGREAVDVLASWNFKHIVRLDKIRLFNQINVELGYRPINIYSPREIATHEED